MKKLIFLLLLLSSQISFAQTGWFWQNPLPQGNNLNAVKFININTGWAVGEKGTFIKTTNRGENWIPQNILFDSSLMSICFIDTLNGFICGKAGMIIKTTNAGLNWTFTQLNDKYELNNIFFINQNTGIIVGYNSAVDGGVIFKTTNGGTNWNVTYSNYSHDNKIRNISFINSNTGWAASQYYLYKTTNGGSNWFLIHNFAFCNDIFFFDTLNGLRTYYKYLYKTTNGGYNYSLYNQYVDTSLYSISFIGSNSGFISCNYGVILKTTNTGINWSFIQTLSKRKLSNTNFIDSLNGFIIGEHGTILKTTNSGNNWSMKNQGKSNKLFSICFLNENTGWISGINTILKTTNGGNQWITQWDSLETVKKICFLNVNTGWIFINNDNSETVQKILKTTNGGNNWILVGSFQNTNTVFYFLKSLCFINENTGWVVGQRSESHFPYPVSYKGVRFSTTNGGTNWTETYTSDCPDFSDIKFINSSTGWIIGNSLTVLKTTNSGDNWFLQKPSFSLNSSFECKIQFVNPNTGWMTGYCPLGSSVIYKSTNGGNNWFIQDSLLRVKLYSLSFTNENSGWVCGVTGNSFFSNGGIIFATSNGGANWIEQPSRISDSLNSIFFITDNTGWAAGNNGAIIKTSSGIQVGINNYSSTLSQNFSINQNYPNPFNATTKINFELPKSTKVKITIYDILGRKLEEIINSYLQAGQHTVNWDAYNYSSGVYFYRIETGDFSQTKKCVMLK